MNHRHGPPIPILHIARPGLAFVRGVDRWQIVDDDAVLFDITSVDTAVDLELYAERVAVLLDRHGLTDLPDTPEELTP